MIRRLLLGFIIGCTFGDLNAKEDPVRQWAKMLSVKADFQSQNYRLVYDEFLGMDSIDMCHFLQQLYHKAGNNNSRFRIRLLHLHGWLNYVGKTCGFEERPRG